MSKYITGLILVFTCSVVHAASLIDPTQPLGYRSSGKIVEQLKLQAIFYGNGRKEAIISGRAVKVGDHIFGKKILSIKKQSVSYESGGVVQTLKLRPSIFK